jgi:DNA-binding PadR family transcriptional regulator
MDLNNIPEAFTLPLRLSLVSCLVEGDKTFNEIKNLTKGSDGNISVQLTKLQNWGYVTSYKLIKIRRTETVYKITPFGLNKLEEYVELLERIIKWDKSI